MIQNCDIDSKLVVAIHYSHFDPGHTALVCREGETPTMTGRNRGLERRTDILASARRGLGGTRHYSAKPHHW